MIKFKYSKLALAVAIYLSSVSTFAEIQSATTNTTIKRINKIEIINISKPNSQGLSHNTYNKFNVEKQGAVLNNALRNGRSELAGTLNKNPHLTNQAASVILNEVVSKNPSTLLGKQEVFGQQADYVLANPNGITCDNCGFINTPRASLIVGKPTISSNDLSYNVSSENALRVSGQVNNKGVDHIDLIAPQVSISSNIDGSKNINVVLGKNNVSLDKDGNTYIDPLSNKGRILDGKIMGSMHAGRIRIHSTDSRAKVNLEAAKLTATETAISAGNIDIRGKITREHNYTNYDRRDKNRVRSVGSVDTSQEKYDTTVIKSDNIAISAKHSNMISGTEIVGKNVVITGDNVRFGKQITKKVHNTVHNQSKGLWIRNEKDFSTEQAVHRTTINANNVKLVSTTNDISGEGLKVNAQNLGIYGQSGIHFSGVIETNTYAADSDFKRESWRLKTGRSHQNAVDQNYLSSEFNIINQVILGSNKDIILSGTKFAVDGDMIVKTPGKVLFNSEQSKHTYNIDDYHRFWGGLAGSKTVGLARNESVSNGSDITVRNNLHIEANKGAKIIGSRVIAQKNGYVIAEQGRLSIDSSYSYLTESQSLRQGRVFNITKLRQNNYVNSSTPNGSTLVSDSNLYLKANKNISIRGSKIESAGLLDISALSGINITGTKNYTFAHINDISVGINGHIEKPTFSIDKTQTAKILFQSIVKKEPIKSIAEKVKDQVKASAQAGLALTIHSGNENKMTITHARSNVIGNNVTVTTKNLVVAGSSLSANNNLNVTANTITTKALNDSVTSRKNNTNATIGLTVNVDQSSITGKVGLGVHHKTTDSRSETASISKLHANNDVNLRANIINHQGTKITSGNNVNQDAIYIQNGVAATNHSENTIGADINISSSAGINKSKVFNSSVDIVASGSNSQKNTIKSTTTTLIVKNNINSNSHILNDQGTSYTAGNNVSLSSKHHNLLATTNISNTKDINAGANANIAVSTSDFNKFNTSVGVGIKYQQNQTNESIEKNATIVANNVGINTSTLNAQANINAAKAIVINADTIANFGQSNQHNSQQGGGFSTNVGVGALIIPEANVALPSIDVNVSANGHRTVSQIGIENSMTSKNITISSPNINLQGTNIITTNSATITASKLNFESVKNSSNNLKVDTAVGVSVGAGATNSGFNAKLDVKKGNESSTNTIKLNANNLTINADQAKLSGISSESNNLSLHTNNLELKAVENTKKQTDVGVGLSLNGNNVLGNWIPNSGSANLDVNVTRNKTFTETMLSSKNAHLVSDNTKIVGSQITANKATGKIKNITEETVINSINEVSVSTSASGSGKITPYSKQNFKETIKKDLKNGTIAGVKANAKLKISVNEKKYSAGQGLSVREKKLRIERRRAYKQYIAHHKQVNFSSHINTNGKESLKIAREYIKHKRM